MLLLYILIGIVILFFIITFCVYMAAFHSPNRKQNDDHNLSRGEQMDQVHDTVITMIDTLNKIPYERVQITSDDGLTLCGRYYHTAEGAPVVIGFHGYRGTPSRDFSGGTHLYLTSGFNLLMIEQRAHCSSEGHTITFGVKERYDGMRWIEYVQERFGWDTPIILAGISMGAATVLMMSGLTLPDNVAGIVADAPYTSPFAIICKVCGDLRIPAAAALPFLSGAARIFGGFGLNDADTSEAVKKAGVPILLIHGEDDRFVPCDMGQKIAAANPEMIRLETFPNAGHGLSFLVDRERYERITSEHFSKILQNDRDTL